jgi:hypothetical protein
MKTQSIFAIVVEAILLVSLLALLSLTAAFVYAILWVLAEIETQPPHTENSEIVAQTLALPPTKPEPEEIEMLAEIITEAIDFTKMTVKQLKRLAKDRNVLNWHNLKKYELICALNG